MKHNWRDVINTVKRYKSFLVVTHHNPDPDALGSSLAIVFWLKALGKKVTVINEDVVNPWLTFLPGVKQIKVADRVKRCDYEIAIICDCGDIERVGKTKRLLNLTKPIINIDHHISNPQFGSINIVDAKASSTSELVMELLLVAKQPIKLPIATLLYAGMMTDTGSFRYDITSSRTHQLVAQCLASGVNPSMMYDRLYPAMPANDMVAFTAIITQAKLVLNNQLFVATLTKKELDAFSPTFDWKERLLSFLRSVSGVKVVMILSELKDGRIRVNLRSQSKIDVARLTAKVGGGGHPKAAGATLDAPIASAAQQMIKLIEQELRKF